MRHVHLKLLHVGNAGEARDLRLLYDRGIQGVVDLAIDEAPATLGRDLIYCRYPIIDGAGNADELISLAIETVCSLVEKQFSTLVACSVGMSRAPLIAAASLARMTNRPVDDCLSVVLEDAPNDVSPVLWNQVKRLCDGWRS